MPGLSWKRSVFLRTRYICKHALCSLESIIDKWDILGDKKLPMQLNDHSFGKLEKLGETHDTLDLFVVTKPRKLPVKHFGSKTLEKLKSELKTTHMSLLQEPDEFNILSGDEFVILEAADDDPAPPYKKHKRVHWSQDLVEIFYFVPTNNTVIPPFTAEYCATGRKTRQKKARRTASALTRSAGQISTVMVMRGLQFITKQLNDLTVGSVSEDRSRRWDDLLQLYMIRERLKDEKGDWV